ncbi:beta-trefoil [Lichtheimia hyalospora FSU 10163]|nr:beta-trefoil [Lichtheimia hyalospora FSU 10163]
MILTSKVAQKSYGTEKRFLCPPPTTVLSGASCNTSTSLSPPKLTVHISGETTSQTGMVEWHAPNGSILDASSAASAAGTAAISNDTTLSGKCVSKHLHINDADEKRKRVEVLVKMQLGNGLQLGTLASKGIKVISKPSKKRQSVKNMELCIHHGTTISLFNRIRSQTVSTKYLGVSTGEQQQGGNGATPGNGTCFVARTGSWDPFVIWIVDTSRAPDMTATTSRKHHPNNPNYPPPPAIALQTDPAQHPLAIHYNQAVVLQCVSTGLVSPVMVIRKVDKGSMVLGGNHLDDLSGTTGGECGDESLGDPVSQLHKIAFQIVQDPSIAHSNKAGFHPHNMDPSTMANEWTLPQSCQPITYLACLNDVVGMHKTTTQRMFRRVSCDVVKPMSLPAKLQNMSQHRRRVNSLNDVPALHHRRGSTSALLDRRGSTDSTSSNSLSDGACWTEDVSDAAVWTIVGTDCATYTFWTPPSMLDAAASPITPFPVISHIPPSAAGGDSLSISGENLTRDLAVWFGDVKCPRTDYRSRESISCSVPDLSELVRSPVITIDEENGSRKLPILLVRGDGVVYRTGKFYTF